MIEQPARCFYRFGHFELQPNERRLLVRGTPATVSSRAFDVLVILVERAGQLVTKDELLERVWAKLVVEENNLQQQISSLRKMLGQETIATVPGRGYCFTLEPHRIAAEPPPPSLISKHNLPHQLTSFVGHENDLTNHARLLDEARLLTFTGIGGCGKTRLALKLAEIVSPSFRDGVWLIDLASATEADRVAMAIAKTLGIREEADKPIVETLCGRLSEQSLLLILDNCEHLVVTCAMVAERLLSTVPGLRVLATSREGLGVAGERAVTVRSLLLPPLGAEQDIDSVRSCEAVRLFVDRARIVVPRFALDATTVGTVAEICRRLDGIPLAIELAAARVKLLSVEQIRANLNDRFRLLTGGHNALPRHQTLRGVIQWSFDHLEIEEKQVLCRLAVFMGGWSLAAASAVAGESDDDLVMIEILERLVHKSLVVVDCDGSSDPRCRMLESVRQYGLERLSASGETTATRARHLAHFLTLCETAASKLNIEEAKLWLSRLDSELPNVLEAHVWCDSAPNGSELGLRLVVALRAYFSRRGLVRLGRQLFRQALARPGAERPSAIRAMALRVTGQFAALEGVYAESRECFEESLQVARALGDRSGIASAFLGLGHVATAEGDRPLAQEHLEQSLSIARDIDDQVSVVNVLNQLGELYRMNREFEQARPLYEEALTISRGRDFNVSANTLLNLATIAIERGDYETARTQILEAASFADRLASHFLWAHILDAIVALAAAVSDAKGAARTLGASDAMHQTRGETRYISDQQFLAPYMQQTRTVLGDAAFEKTYADGYRLSRDEAIREARIRLARGA